MECKYGFIFTNHLESLHDTDIDIRRFTTVNYVVSTYSISRQLTVVLLDVVIETD